MAETQEAFVVVNGERVAFSAGQSLAAVLGGFGIEPGAGGVAVAVDGAVVPRSQWSSTSLRGGEAVDVVRAVQGG